MAKNWRKVITMGYAMAIPKDEEILFALGVGNTDYALTTFVRTYQNFVFNTAYRYLKSSEDAEDVSQEVFIKAVESLKKFRGESSIKTWLYRITKNYCINYIRKHKVRTMFSFFSEIAEDKRESYKDRGALPDGIMSNNELESKFLNAINNLPEKQRETFALRYYDDLPYSEISKLLGTSVGGLKANYYQAVKKLAIELQEFRDIL